MRKDGHSQHKNIFDLYICLFSDILLFETLKINSGFYDFANGLGVTNDSYFSFYMWQVLLRWRYVVVNRELGKTFTMNSNIEGI